MHRRSGKVLFKTADTVHRVMDILRGTSALAHQILHLAQLRHIPPVECHTVRHTCFLLNLYKAARLLRIRSRRFFQHQRYAHAHHITGNRAGKRNRHNNNRCIRFFPAQHLPVIRIAAREPERGGKAFRRRAVNIAACGQFHTRFLTGIAAQGRPMHTAGMLAAADHTNFEQDKTSFRLMRSFPGIPSVRHESTF